MTRYYCNRNPRSLELLGMAEKPRGFETAHRRVDYYHRSEVATELNHPNSLLSEYMHELGAR